MWLSARLEPAERKKKQHQTTRLLPNLICTGFATNMLFRTAENGVIDLEEILLNLFLWPVLEGHHIFSSHFFVSRQKILVCAPLLFTARLLKRLRCKLLLKGPFLVCASISPACSEEKMGKWMNCKPESKRCLWLGPNLPAEQGKRKKVCLLEEGCFATAHRGGAEAWSFSWAWSWAGKGPGNEDLLRKQERPESSVEESWNPLFLLHLGGDPGGCRAWIKELVLQMSELMEMNYLRQPQLKTACLHEVP